MSTYREARAAGSRADARRNQERVFKGAQAAFAQIGFDASYHDIARLAGVGVGTVYRRYPKRDELLEMVLLGLLDELTGRAEEAAGADDPWAAFVRFFTDLSSYVRRHAGLSAQLPDRGGERVAEGRARLLAAVKAVHERARGAGLRQDVGWEDVLHLAQIAGATGCGLYPNEDPQRYDRAIRIIVDGLRAKKPGASSIPEDS